LSLISVTNGAFGLECPACPHPGQNLPVGWEDAPEEQKCVPLRLVIILELILA
jgi:hypothetical protein